MTTPFASVELAARIERAERSLIVEGARACAERRDVEVFVRDVAGGAAVDTAPGSPLNKVVGAGLVELDEVSLGERLAELEDAFDARRAPLLFEVATLADPLLVRVLSRRGYELVGFENVLAADPRSRPAPRPTTIDVRPSEASELDAWIDVVVDGFAAPDVQGVASHESFPRDALDAAIRDLASTTGMRRFLALRDGEVAGAASMRIQDGVAQLTGAATLAPHRRRGVQTALLDARLAIAARDGCDLAVVTTQPGSKSQENVERFGFRLVYARAALLRPPARAEVG